MLFMVIERFRDNDMVPIYRRVRDAGGPQAVAGVGAPVAWVWNHVRDCAGSYQQRDSRSRSPTLGQRVSGSQAAKTAC